MENTIEINGQIYTKNNQDYSAQLNTITSYLGNVMGEALVDADAYIAGGAVLSSFTHAEVKDIDVYFPSRESLAQAFVAVTKDWEGVYLGHTDKSITLKDLESGAIVQFIYFDFFETAQDIFDCFDFSVCMAALNMKDMTFSFGPNFISDMASRTLHFNPGTRYPYISLLRTKKYEEKGYTLSRGVTLSIAVACSRKQINSWEEAKEQLGGVYGNEITLKIEEGAEFSLDAFYKILREIPEHSAFINNCNYESIFFELTGVTYSDFQEQEREKLQNS